MELKYEQFLTMDPHKAEGDPLEDLLQSCASITDKALSYRTFTSQNTCFRADESIQALIREEQEIARWLDRQTLEYRPLHVFIINQLARLYPDRLCSGVSWMSRRRCSKSPRYCLACLNLVLPCKVPLVQNLNLPATASITESKRASRCCFTAVEDTG
jgi:hypothetical protein